MIAAVETPNALVTIVASSGLAPASAESLRAAFQPFFDDAAKAVHAAADIKVTDATQVSEIKRARAARLVLKEIRVGLDKKRVALKEDSLRTGQVIDKVARVIREQIEPAEKVLEDMEKIAERAEAARIATLQTERAEALRAYADPAFYPSLGSMPVAEWDRLLSMLRADHEQRVEAERKAQAERDAAEAARKAEEARLAAENARLKAEAEAREAAAKAEREAAEATLRAEREAAAKAAREAEGKAAAERQRIEAEARKEREAREAVEAAERKRQAEEAARAKVEADAKRKAERAPDREKLLALATALRAIQEPSVTDAATATRRRCMGLIATTAGAIEELVGKELA